MNVQWVLLASPSLDFQISELSEISSFILKPLGYFVKIVLIWEGLLLKTLLFM